MMNSKVCAYDKFTITTLSESNEQSSKKAKELLAPREYHDRASGEYLQDHCDDNSLQP